MQDLFGCAGIKKNVSPHTSWHSFATDLYREIKDPVTVKNALGHSSITTTMIYVHLVGADGEKALSGGNGDKVYCKRVVKNICRVGDNPRLFFILRANL